MRALLIKLGIIATAFVSTNVLAQEQAKLTARYLPKMPKIISMVAEPAENRCGDNERVATSRKIVTTIDHAVAWNPHPLDKRAVVERVEAELIRQCAADVLASFCIDLTTGTVGDCKASE